jgi:hypothetical protein
LVKIGVGPTGFDHHVVFIKELFELLIHFGMENRISVRFPAAKEGVGTVEDYHIARAGAKGNGVLGFAGAFELDGFIIGSLVDVAGVTGLGDVDAFLDGVQRLQESAGMGIAALGSDVYIASRNNHG